MNWEAGSDDGASDTEYSYEDYEGDNSGYSSEEYEWELANSQRERDRFQEELLRQLAYELWEEVTWARRGGYHSNESPIYSSTRSPQPMDIDEVYLIDLPQWGDSITGLEFEEEIDHEAAPWENSSFTWNQADWNYSTSADLCPDMSIDPDEWAQPFDEYTDWETYNSM